MIRKKYVKPAAFNYKPSPGMDLVFLLLFRKKVLMSTVTSVKIGRISNYLFRKDVTSYNNKSCKGIVVSILSEMRVEDLRKVKQFDTYCQKSVLKFQNP